MTTTPTAIRVSGTPISLNPALSTPFPQAPGCAANTYLGGGSLIAWDVEYGRIFDPDAKTCHPPEVSDWWWRKSQTATHMGFGPAFECPELYHAVHTAVVPAGDDGNVQEVFCCPSYA